MTNNISSANITTKGKVINGLKAAALAIVVVSIIQIIVDRIMIAIVMSDIDLWFKYRENYDTRFWLVFVILAVVYYFKGINKIVDKARKANDRLRYHLYDNSNPQ